MSEESTEPKLPISYEEAQIASEAIGEWINTRYSTSEKKDKMLDLQEKLRNFKNMIEYDRR